MRPYGHRNHHVPARTAHLGPGNFVAMSNEQKLQLDGILSQGSIDTDADVPSLRAAFRDLMSRVPTPPDLRQKPLELGGVGGVEVTVDGSDDTNGVILYFHSGVYVIGYAEATVPLVGDLVRRTRGRGITLEYRLAPEHPYPAAVEDARAAYAALLAGGIGAGRICVAGESAGGGLAVALLLSLRDAGLPLPSCAYLLSPYADLTLSGESLAAKEGVDRLLSPEGLRARVPDYVGEADAADPLISPIFGDLSGLPPLLIQVGSHEVLLSDAVRLASRAAMADTDVRLEVTSGVPHVFQSFAGLLDEAKTALDLATGFITSHLTRSAT